MKTAATRQAKPTTAITVVKGRTLQRKCACGQHTIAGGECASCRDEREAGSRDEPTLSTSSSGPTAGAGGVPEQASAGRLGFSRLRANSPVEPDGRERTIMDGNTLQLAPTIVDQSISGSF